ncbi:MAG: SpaH/EbpB family LPXTG-anchored major pilin, partial [Clostridium sp.]
KGAVLKGNPLSVDKKITGKKGTAQAPIDETTAAIGDTLSYTVTADVPHYPANAIHTTFKVKDTPTNLEIKQNTVKVYGVKANGTETDLTGQFVPELDNKGVLTVDMSSKYQTLFCANGTYPYATVKITYDAVLMESASIATGNTNKPALIYGTDPYTDSDASDEEIPGDGKQKVYTYGLNLTKKNSDNDVLSNAVFSVKRGDTKLKFIEDANEKGTYTLAKDQGAAGATDQLTTNDQGTFNIKGLDANVEYVLEETKAPSGYFRNHGSVAFTITPAADTEGKLTGAIKSVTAKDEKGTALDNAGAWTCGIDQNKTAYVAVTLKDTKIPFLPATGGMGTVIFTIVGDALMILAIVLFIRSRKGRKEDK